MLMKKDKILVGKGPVSNVFKGIREPNSWDEVFEVLPNVYQAFEHSVTATESVTQVSREFSMKLLHYFNAFAGLFSSTIFLFETWTCQLKKINL